ncbi:centromere-associated protein E isoform X2 [Vespa crabro]|uniref:centromere-associated protein E isoform X2 n=1 Tax=Vespa crabro TaxID=7445 RepID=UPI001F0145E8|nr:centromere-associated protein E isoform X2 [Vespa crabro]
MSDSIKVAIKVRPLIKREKDENLPKQWIVHGNYIVSTDAEMKKRGDGGFHFDHIFDEVTKNKDVFDTVVKPIVDAAVNGFNGTVFAYGQTSSGKTFTMMGDLNEPGIITLAIEHMFDAIANTLRREFLLRVSYLEIYNEKVNDLLNKSGTDLRMHEDNGQIVLKCKEEVTNSPEHVLSIMKKGNKSRRIEETDMNERSSRSHTIFRITIESRETDAGSDGAIQVSQLNLVDLAGSERAGQTGATGERFKEGRHINMSLSTLGLVIKQLSESQDIQKYVNFRDSKLTRLLQASLGGNAMTAIICTITPAALEESQCTLSFASRAKSVKNKPQINEVMSDAALLKRYAKQIAKLNTELDKMKQENRTAEEMENRLHEKDRVNQLLEERIELLKTKIVSGNNTNIEDSFGYRSKRRRTWAGAVTFKQNLSIFQPSYGLPTIKEMSPEKSCRKSIIQSVDLMDQSFQTAFTDFELELINDEKDRENEDSIDSDRDMYITKNRHQNRVTFVDDVLIYKSNYDIYESTPEKKGTPCQTNDNQYSSNTPEKVLRERIKYLKQEFDELREFTTLEKQIYIENHQCYVNDEKQQYTIMGVDKPQEKLKGKGVKTEEDLDLQQQTIMNVTSENSLLKNVILEVLKYANNTADINGQVDVLLNDTSETLNGTILDLPFKEIEVKYILSKLQNKIMESIKRHEMENLEKISELGNQMLHLKSENIELKEKLVNAEKLMTDSTEPIQERRNSLLIDMKENFEFEESTVKSKEIENILEQGKQLIEFSPIKPRRSLEQLNSNNKTCEVLPFVIKENLIDCNPVKAEDAELSVRAQRKRSILEERENIIAEMNEYNELSVNEKIDNFDFEDVLTKLHKHLNKIEQCEILKLHQLNEIFTSQNQELQYVLSELNRKKIETDYDHIRNFINGSINFKSLLLDLDVFIKSITGKNKKMKEQLQKQLYVLTESFNDNIDNEELAADLDLKTQELHDIKGDVVGLKLDMKKLQRTIFLLTAENEELSAKLTAERESKADCLTTNDLNEQISEMKNEKTELLNEIQILDKQIKCLKSKKMDMEEGQFCIGHQDDGINKSISSNIESPCANIEKHINVDFVDVEEIDSLTNINESMNDKERSTKDDNALFLDCSLPETELKTSSKNNTERDENNIEELLLDGSALKSELIKLKEKVTLLTEENAKLLKKSLDISDGDEGTDDDKSNILFEKCINSKGTIDYLLQLNKKLADLKIISCTKCVQMKELNENNKDVKLKTKMLTDKLENLQEKFNRKCADIEVLKNKANEESFLHISEISLDGSSLDGINVTSVEEEVSLLNKEIQILQDDHVKLSFLYKEKCNEIERLHSANMNETNVVSPLKKDTKRNRSKVNKLKEGIDHVKADLEDLKNNVICDLKKALNEIKTLKSDNDELSKMVSHNNQLLETTDKGIKRFENEVINLNAEIDNYKMVQEQMENEKYNLKEEMANIKANIEQKEVTINDLQQIINECRKESDDLKEKIFYLENIEEEENIDMTRTIHENKHNRGSILNDENQKLKDDLNSARTCIINEMKSLKPTEDDETNDFLDKSINSLFFMFLERITLKEKEIIDIIQEQFFSEREKLENERQLSINAERHLRLCAEELKIEMERLKTDIRKGEEEHRELLDKISYLERLLRESNDEREILRKKIQSFEMDYDNAEIYFNNKDSEMKSQQDDNIINKKEELLIEEGMKNKEIELEIEMKRTREEYEGKLDSLGTTLETYKIKNIELMEQLENLETNERDLQNMLAIRTDELAKSNESLERIKADIESFTNANDELNREMEKRSASITKLNAEIRDLVELVESNKIENVALIKKLEEFEINEKNLNVMLNKKMDELVENNENVEKMKIEIEDLRTICNGLKHEIEHKNARIAEVTTLLEGKTETLSEYKTKLESITPEYELLQKQLNEKILTIHKHMSELESLKVDNEMHLTNMKETLNLENVKYAELNKQLGNVNNEKISLLRELDTLKEHYSQLEEKNMKLERKLRNSNSKIKLETNMQDLLEKNKVLQSNLDGAYNCITELKDKKNHLLEELLSAKERHESLLEENRKMKELLSNKMKQNVSNVHTTLQEQYDILSNEKSKITLELEENKILLCQKEKDLKYYINQFEELRRKNQELDEEAEELIRENEKLTEKIYSYFDDDNSGDKLKVEISILKEENKRLQDELTKFDDVKKSHIKLQTKITTDTSNISNFNGEVNGQECITHGMLQQKDQLKCNVECNINEEINNDELANLKKQIQELEHELVSKNGRIASLQLQIQRESFPYQKKCKDLEENVLAFKNKNIHLEGEIKKLRHVMSDINMKECYMCKNRYINTKNQYVQTIPTNKIQFCGTSSGIVDEHIQIQKLEKEKSFMKQLCRSRCRRIKELEKKIMEFENAESLSKETNIAPNDISCNTPRF